MGQPHQLRVLDRDRFRLPDGQPYAVDPLMIHCVGMAHNLRGGWGAWNREERDEFLDLLRQNLDYCYGKLDEPPSEAIAPSVPLNPSPPPDTIPERFQRRNSWSPERRAAQSERAKAAWTPERRAAYAEMARNRFKKERPHDGATGGDQG